MLDLGCADAERQRSERAMRGGMGIAANDGGARQGPALFRPDDMHDALADIVHLQIFDAEFARIVFQRGDLFGGFRIGDALGAVLGRHIVIGDGKRKLRAARLAAGGAQAFESLRTCHFVHQMAVNIEDGGFARRLMHQMCVPDLVVERFTHSSRPFRPAKNTSRPPGARA